MTPEGLTFGIRAGLFAFILLTAFAYLTYMERRVISWFQWRVGPNRVGPWGLLQPLADGVKTAMKQEMVPRKADKLLYFIAPLISFSAAFTMFALIPVGQGVYLSNPSVAVLMFLGLSSLGVYGLILAGWSSQSKFPFLGALRSCAQVISYELSLGMALFVPIMLMGSLNIGEIAGIYRSDNWHPVYWIPMIGAGIVFTIAALAETARVPFDLPECEAEIVAGYHTEYSSMKFAMFTMGEYIAMAAMSSIIVHFFLGSFHLSIPFAGTDLTNWLGLMLGNPDAVFGPPKFLGLPQDWWNAVSVSALSISTIGTYFIKTLSIIFFFMWIRATFPRYRYDQLMRIGWKVLLPWALALIVLASLLLVIVSSARYTKALDSGAVNTEVSIDAES